VAVHQLVRAVAQIDDPDDRYAVVLLAASEFGRMLYSPDEPRTS
jgi:hypothetical protein